MGGAVARFYDGPNENWKENDDRHGRDEFHGLTEKRAENKQIASLKNERAIFADLFCGSRTNDISKYTNVHRS